MTTHVSPPTQPHAEEHEGGILTIDLSAIRQNYRLLRGLAGQAECGGVVKADGYGLGASHVVRALLDEGCRTFFTAHLTEAIALRDDVPDSARLVVLHGPSPGTEAAFLENDIVPVLNSVPQVRTWSAIARSRGGRLPAWLQFDTGMARFGLGEDEIDGLDLDNLYIQAVMSHLACADDPTHPANASQLANFTRLRRRFAGVPASLAASSGIFLGPAFHFDIVRPGAALHGVNPLPGRPNPLAPVIRLQGRVLQLRDVPAGTAIGYGHTTTTDRPTRLATVAVGYADGFLRSTGDAGCAWLGDTRLNLMGRVSMDSIIVDVTGVSLEPGMLIDLIGPHHDADQAGSAAGTIGYEILTSLGHRFQRRIIPLD